MGWLLGLSFRSSVAACAGAAAISVLMNCAARAQVVLPSIDIWSSRLGGGIAGASTSVITAEDIARSPGATLQDLLSQEAGVQTWSTFGGVNGAGTVIDMRGFGATAASNTLVLLNGRRLTDVDLGGVDLSAIPRDSIERIEITRGNAGAVLYGNGAVGGTINIVTKTGAAQPPSARIEGGFGSFGEREGSVSARASSGPFSAAAFGFGLDSEGYRVNNAARQRNGVGDFRYQGTDGSAYLTITGDDQHLGLPGARMVTLTGSQLDTDRRGATTPTAYADKNGFNITTGVSRTIVPGFELVLDGSLRRKDQTAFSSLFGFDTSDLRTLTTASLTPRAIVNGDIFGVSNKIIAGVDYYNADLDMTRSAQVSDSPYHRYRLNQQSLAAYWQQTASVSPSTDISWGARLENIRVGAGDRFDPAAPGAFFFDTQATPLDRSEIQHALHLGFEHRFSPMFAVFGRIGRSFRTPNVDERVGVNAFPVDFNLKTQTSRDIEGGFRFRHGGFELQTTAYDMRLNDEILFIPFPPIGANINLDPTHRYGVENIASLKVSDTIRIKGGLTYTRAVFREGIYAGNDVPLVSRWTGNVGVSWDIYRKMVVFDGVVRFIGDRRMDNDQANFQPLIPAHTLVDVRLGGEVDKFFWSVSVQNLFDVQYFDYAVASSSTFGTYNAYPQPGRTYMVKLGARF